VGGRLKIRYTSFATCARENFASLLRKEYPKIEDISVISALEAVLSDEIIRSKYPWVLSTRV
jgi:hypothetical protein